MPSIAKRDDLRGWRRPPAPSWIVLLLVGFALVTLDVLLDGPLRQADHPVSAWLSVHVHGAWWAAAQGLTAIGQRHLAVIPLGAAAVAAACRVRSGRPLLWTLAVLVVLDIAVDALKDLVGRTGPGLPDRVRSGGLEYPSGHTINGVVLWGVTLRLLRDLGGRALWLTYRRRWRIALATGFGAGVGVLALNWHWLTDVIAGWLLGPPALWLALGVYGEPREGAKTRTRRRRALMIARR